MDTDVQKWEYCLLAGFGFNPGGGGWCTSYPKFYRFESSGIKLVTDFKESRVSEKDAVAQHIAQLGEEGWEITSYSGSVIYFKRPVPSRS